MRVKFLFQFITVLIGIFFCERSLGKEFYEGPYFWSRPELHKKMQEQREVPVSVTVDSSGDVDVWSMKGAGIVRATCPVVYRWAQDFEQLKKMKEHFPDVQWNADKTEITITVQVLMKTQKIRFKIWRTEDLVSVPHIRRLHFEVLDGAYKGAIGALILTDAAQQQCEAGIISLFHGKIIAFGSSVFAIAVEGLLQHVAKSLRTGVENAQIEY